LNENRLGNYPGVYGSYIILILLIVALTPSAAAVEKGAITIVAAGPQNYFLGEEIKFTGTNSETNNTYLFITGTNLPSNGGQMTNPRSQVWIQTPGDTSIFSPSNVLMDNTWEYKWQTANLNLDAGTYTVYAIVTPSDKSSLANTQYARVSVIIRKPFISASTSQSSISPGDSFFIRGYAEGRPSPGVAIWIFGADKNSYEKIPISSDGSFIKEYSPSDTAQWSTGQYEIVVQHPMYNENFDVIPGTGLNSANALIVSLNNPSIDDTYAKLKFSVSSSPSPINTYKNDLLTHNTYVPRSDTTIPLIIIIVLLLCCGAGYGVYWTRKQPSTDQHPQSNKPTSQQTLFRSSSTEINDLVEKASTLTIFRQPVIKLISAAGAQYDKGNYPNAQIFIDKAKSAITSLAYFESNISSWKAEGFDTSPMENLNTEDVAKVRQVSYNLNCLRK